MSSQISLTQRLAFLKNRSNLKSSVPFQSRQKETTAAWVKSSKKLRPATLSLAEMEKTILAFDQTTSMAPLNLRSLLQIKNHTHGHLKALSSRSEQRHQLVWAAIKNVTVLWIMSGLLVTMIVCRTNWEFICHRYNSRRITSSRREGSVLRNSRTFTIKAGILTNLLTRKPLRTFATVIGKLVRVRLERLWAFTNRSIRRCH